jgi:hypothetical protein
LGQKYVPRYHKIRIRVTIHAVARSPRVNGSNALIHHSLGIGPRSLSVLPELFVLSSTRSVQSKIPPQHSESSESDESTSLACRSGDRGASGLLYPSERSSYGGDRNGTRDSPSSGACELLEFRASSGENACWPLPRSSCRDRCDGFPTKLAMLRRAELVRKLEAGGDDVGGSGEPRLWG